MFRKQSLRNLSEKKFKTEKKKFKKRKSKNAAKNSIKGTIQKKNSSELKVIRSKDAHP